MVFWVGGGGEGRARDDDRWLREAAWAEAHSTG